MSVYELRVKGHLYFGQRTSRARKDCIHSVSERSVWYACLMLGILPSRGLRTPFQTVTIGFSKVRQLDLYLPVLRCVLGNFQPSIKRPYRASEKPVGQTGSSDSVLLLPTP